MTAVVDMVAEVGNVDAARVQPGTKLRTELGLHSLAMVRLHRQLCAEFDVDVDLPQVMSTACVNDLVALMLAQMPNAGGGEASGDSDDSEGSERPRRRRTRRRHRSAGNRVDGRVAQAWPIVQELVAELTATDLARVQEGTNLQLDLGADSLLLVRLHRRLVAELDLDFDLMQMLNAQTAGEVARVIAELLPRDAGAGDGAHSSDDESYSDSGSDSDTLADAGCDHCPHCAAQRSGALVPRPMGLADAGTPFLVAVVGMACRVPQCDTPAAFWRALAAGTDLVSWFNGDGRTVSASGEDVAAGFSLSPEHVRGFDPAFFHLSRREASIMDPQQRLFLECCYEALEAGGYANETSVGVFSSTSLNTYACEGFASCVA